MTKVIHVHLINEKRNYYFGSITAVYSTLTEVQVGIKKSTLLHSHIADGVHILTKRALIMQGHLIRGGDGDN